MSPPEVSGCLPNYPPIQPLTSYHLQLVAIASGVDYWVACTTGGKGDLSMPRPYIPGGQRDLVSRECLITLTYRPSADGGSVQQEKIVYVW